jgi:hypothetical protein
VPCRSVLRGNKLKQSARQSYSCSRLQGSKLLEKQHKLNVLLLVQRVQAGDAPIQLLLLGTAAGFTTTKSQEGHLQLLLLLVLVLLVSTLLLVPV